MRSVLLVLGMTWASSACTEGEVAKPAFTEVPERYLQVVPRLTALPEGVSVESMTHYMTARYESRKLACSRIDHSRGGSVDNPVYEVPLEGSYGEGFRLWMDLIQPDRCAWRLTGLIYGVKVDGKMKIETGLGAEQLEHAPVTRYCAWGGTARGRCLGVAEREPVGREQADTVVVIGIVR